MIEPGDIFYCPCPGGCSSCGRPCLAVAIGYEDQYGPGKIAGYVFQHNRWKRALWIPQHVKSDVDKNVTDKELAIATKAILLGELTK